MNRRLRGLVAMVSGGAIAGAIAGAALGFLVLLLPGPSEITARPGSPGGVVLVPAFMLGMVGAIGGGAFGALLMFTERGRTIDELRVHRVAFWAALATAFAIRLVGWSWTTVALGSVISAALGAAGTWIAKRAKARAGIASLEAPLT